MLTNVSILNLIVAIFTLSFIVCCYCKPLSDQTYRKNENENERFKRSGGTEVQGILSMIEDAMNEAPIGSRPKQVRFSVVGKRNSEDLENILKQIETELADDSSSSRVVPVRFSLTGKK